MGEAFKLGKNLYGVVGSISRNAELRNTQNGKTFAKFSVKAGKREDDSWVYVDCKAWGPLAGYCADLQKGDPFIGIGRIESREYEGKTYTDLMLDWCNSPMLATGATARCWRRRRKRLLSPPPLRRLPRRTTRRSSWRWTKMMTTGNFRSNVRYGKCQRTNDTTGSNSKSRS